MTEQDDKMKDPDLSFERHYGNATEGIELYLSDDGYLEIQGWNCDADHFTIILDPFELEKLKSLLRKV